MMMMMTMMKINEISNTWERNETKASTEGGMRMGRFYQLVQYILNSQFAETSLGASA